MKDIQITINGHLAYARVEHPAEHLADLEYQILDAHKQPAPRLADQLTDQRVFESVERQVGEQLGINGRSQ